MGRHRATKDNCKHAANSACYALGHRAGNGFVVRRVVWGMAMASMEVRDGEQIRRAIVLVDSGPRRVTTNPRLGGATPRATRAPAGSSACCRSEGQNNEQPS
jgi:hypothetical protein